MRKNWPLKTAACVLLFVALWPSLSLAGRKVEQRCETSLSRSTIQTLIKKGYDPGIAERLARHAPQLAAHLARSKNGGPKHVLEWNQNAGKGVSYLKRQTVKYWKTGKSTYFYRGFDIHPYDYNSQYISSINPTEMNGGTLNDAMAYSNSPNFREHKPLPPGRHKDLTFIFEMQIPKLAVSLHQDHWISYSRKVIPDDTIFVRRVGIRDWSKAKEYPSGDLDCPIVWRPYDQVFDEFGKVRPHANW